MKTASLRLASNHAAAGFARLDLLVVLVTLGLLFGLWAPALGKSQAGSRALECLANKRRLITAWSAFVADNEGLMPGVEHGGTAQNPQANDVFQPWTTGWLDWTTTSQNTNTLFQTDRRFSSLAPFLAGSTSAFQCPSDIYLSAVQANARWTRRARSVSGNLAVGIGNAAAGPLDSYYRIRTNVAQFASQSPSQIWVYVDEHPDSMNDGGFFPPAAVQWIDLPAALHDRGAAFAFADAHAEVHQWVSPRTAAPVRFIYTAPIIDPAGRLDISWVRERSPHD